MQVGNELQRRCIAGAVRFTLAKEKLFDRLRDTKGQGTTEYAILVGVLVVIAILAVAAFKGKIQTLWDAITGGFEKL